MDESNVVFMASGPNGEAVPYRDTIQGLIERVRTLEIKVDELESALE